MSEQKQQTEPADGQSRLTDGLEDVCKSEVSTSDFTGCDKVLYFHFHSVSYEDVRSAVKNGLESINLPDHFLVVSRGNGEIKIETKCIDETGHIGND